MSAADELRKLHNAAKMYGCNLGWYPDTKQYREIDAYLWNHAADIIALIDAAEAFDTELMQRDMEHGDDDDVPVPWKQVVALQKALKPFTKEQK